MGVELTFDMGENGTVYIPTVDLHAIYGQWEFGDPSEGANGTITMTKYFYNLSAVMVEDETGGDKPVTEPPFPWWLVGIVAAIAILAIAYKFVYPKIKDKRKIKKKKK
jgi:hypothetical protein